MKGWMQFILLALILILAAFLRLTHLDWDQYNHYHPDERYITWVATSIEWPQDMSTVLVPNLSSINPYFWPDDAASSGVELEQGEQRRFAYGHLPLYMGVGATRLIERIGANIGPLLPHEWLLTRDLLNQAKWIEFRHLTAVGRFLTALVDLATVGLLFFVGRTMFGPLVGLLSAALLAFNVMHMQLARFFTVDPYLTFFVLATIGLLVLAVTRQDHHKQWYLVVFLAAAATGLAVGSKFSSILLFIPLGVTVAISKPSSQKKRTLKTMALTIFIAAVVMLSVFAITNPFAVIDFSCDVVSPAYQMGPLRIPSLNWGSCYLQNLTLQGSMVRGTRDVPFVRQYAGTIPFLYFVEMQLRWGMGLVLGLVAFLGFIWAIIRASRKVYETWSSRQSEVQDAETATLPVIEPSRFPFSRPEYVVLAWTLPYFIFTGVLTVKFMRYMQPLVPFLMLYGAAMLLSIPRLWWRRVAVAFVLVTTLLYALAFLNTYRQPHPWIAASNWIYQNVEEDSIILSERWDDTLPDNINDGQRRLRRDVFEIAEVNWLTGTEQKDSEGKLINNLELVAAADYLVLASNRNYGVIPRLPDRYPLSNRYYPLLFEGELGFEVAYVGTRTPNLFGIHLKPDNFSWPGLMPPQKVEDYVKGLRGINLGRFDESFTVYDQPFVIVLENEKRLSVEEMLSRFSIS
jgi:hypothetical protein